MIEDEIPAPPDAALIEKIVALETKLLGSPPPPPQEPRATPTSEDQ